MKPFAPTIQQADLKLFGSMPGNSALLLPDAPVYTIIAVTEDYEKTSGQRKEDLVGKGLFEAFPPPADSEAGYSAEDLKASLEYARSTGKAHRLPLHRYDIPTGGGAFEERYWSALNKPVVNAAGEVLYIIHHAEDVTEKIKSEQRDQLLGELQQRYQEIITAPILMCILKGEDYSINMANRQTLDYWGRSHDVIGRPLMEVMPELEGQGFIELMNEVKKSGKEKRIYEKAVRLNRNKKEETFYLDFIFYPYTEQASGSRPTGVVCLATDVTEGVAARRAVEESEQEVRAIVDSAPFPIGVYTGREMRIKMANQSIIDVWGKGPDVIGKPYAEILPELKGTGIYESLDSVITTGIPFHARNQRVDLVVDGKLQPFYFNYSFTPLFNREGKIYGVMNTAAEITDLHHAKQQVEQSERNFRSMILQAPVAMCILLGPRFVVDQANEAMLTIWGKPRAHVMQQPIFTALPDAKHQGLEAVMEAVYQTGEPFYANERLVQLLRNGAWETVYQNFVYQPYRDAEGKILGILAISVDVTSQVQARQKIEDIVVQRTGELEAANKALVKSNEELRRLNANLEDFAYAASHDLKEPIRKIHFFSDRLRGQLEEKLTTEQTLYFERLENASRRMGALVDELLAYSQAARGFAEEEEVDLNKKLQLVLGDLELEIQQKSARITIDPLPAIRGSKRQIQQLFQNLITNALKYNKPGTAPSIHISASVIRGAEAAGHVAAADADTAFHQVIVKDEGIGFPQEDAERIFNVFTRLHGNAEYRGTGVGLSIAQKVVQNHNGYIWAESSPGKGATFFVLLPL